MVWYGLIRIDITGCDMIWYYMICYDMTWYDKI